MKRMNGCLTALAALGILGLVTLPVYALAGGVDAAAGKTMCKAMDDAKVTLGKAIEAAEAASKGKAIGAWSTWEGGKLGFAVYCMVGDKMSMVAVDGTGKAGKAEDAKMMSMGGDAKEAPKPAPKPGG